MALLKRACGVVAIFLAFIGKASGVPLRLTVQPASGMDITVTLSEGLNSSDSAASSLSGTIDTEIDFDLQGRPVAFRIITADIMATDASMSLPLGFPLGSLDVNTHDLHFNAFTPDAPPNRPVDPATGEYALSDHVIVLDGGMAEAESLLYSDQFDFAAEPEQFQPPDGLFGFLTQPNGPAGGDVMLSVPIELAQEIAQVEAPIVGTVIVDLMMNGQLMAIGHYEPPQVEGDTNGDGKVDLADLNNVRNNFGGTGTGDTNDDGVVDLQDLNAVRNNFGAGEGGLAAPEPSAGLLLALTAVMLSSRKLLA